MEFNLLILVTYLLWCFVTAVLLPAAPADDESPTAAPVMDDSSNLSDMPSGGSDTPGDGAIAIMSMWNMAAVVMLPATMLLAYAL